MDKDQVKDLIERLRLLQETIANAYLENTLMLTEIGAPKEAFEMLENENVYLMNETSQRIKNAEYMLATM